MKRAPFCLGLRASFETDVARNPRSADIDLGSGKPEPGLSKSNQKGMPSTRCKKRYFGLARHPLVCHTTSTNGGSMMHPYAKHGNSILLPFTFLSRVRIIDHSALVATRCDDCYSCDLVIIRKKKTMSISLNYNGCLDCRSH